MRKATLLTAVFAFAWCVPVTAQTIEPSASSTTWAPSATATSSSYNDSPTLYIAEHVDCPVGGGSTAIRPSHRGNR